MWSEILRAQYKGRLFYGKDAFEGLHTMDRLMELVRSGEDDPDFGRVLGGRKGVPARRGADDGADRKAVTKPPRAPSVATDNPVPVPPFIGDTGRTGHPAGQDQPLLERDFAVPQPMGLPPVGR